MTWLTVAALPLAVIFALLIDASDPSDASFTFAVLGGVSIVAGLTDFALAWILARRWGVARVLKERTRVAEEAADRNDHHAVLSALNPVKRFWGSEEIYLTARSRIALRKAGEL